MLTAFAALVLSAGHFLARPHVLALPVMLAWVGGLLSASERREAPSFWLLPLLALWANLHGGFVFRFAGGLEGLQDGQVLLDGAVQALLIEGEEL